MPASRLADATGAFSSLLGPGRGDGGAPVARSGQAAVEILCVSDRSSLENRGPVYYERTQTAMGRACVLGFGAVTGGSGIREFFH